MTDEAKPTSEIWKSASCQWCRRPGLLVVSGIRPHSLAVITAKGLSSSTFYHCKGTCECHSHTTAFPPSSVPEIYCPVKSVLLRDLLSSISKFPLVWVSHLRKKALCLMWSANSLEKILMLGKTEGRRRRGQQRMRCLDVITDSMDMGLSKLRKIVKDRETWHAAVHGVSKSWTWQWLNNNEYTGTKISKYSF